MDQLLHNSTLLLIIITLLYIVITGIKMTERMRVVLVYIFSFALALSGAFSLWHITVGATIVLLLSLEFLSYDVWRLKVISRLDSKLIDFLYRMFVEYAYSFYLLAMVALFFAHRIDVYPLQVLCYIVAASCVVASLAFLTSQKYITKPIKDIVRRFQADILTYDTKLTPHTKQLFDILVSMEDRSYFIRKPRQHVMPLSRIIKKGLAYLKVNRDSGLYPTVRSVFSRGYGTIEMQLLRSIGIEFGYQYTVRRKMFEVVYANILLNGYYDYLRRARGNYYQYDYFILIKYLESVRVRINQQEFDAGESSSLLKAFGKASYGQITKEEFFVWCLGLPHRDFITPEVVDYYSTTINDYNLNRAKIDKILKRFI